MKLKSAKLQKEDQFEQWKRNEKYEKIQYCETSRLIKFHTNP